MTTDDDLFREWDLYDRIGLANYMKQREVSAAVRLALETRSEPLRVLDLGCEDGRMSYAILENAKVSEFVGIDLSASGLERLERRAAPGAGSGDGKRTLRQGDIEAELRALPSSAFDLVYAGYSLHHYQAKAKLPVLDEIARVLDRGGWFLWTDIIRGEGESRDSYIDRLRTEIGSNWLDLTPEERVSVVEHVRGCDFPEPESWMIEQVKSRGIEFAGKLFHDLYYTTMRFVKLR